PRHLADALLGLGRVGLGELLLLPLPLVVLALLVGALAGPHRVAEPLVDEAGQTRAELLLLDDALLLAQLLVLLGADEARDATRPAADDRRPQVEVGLDLADGVGGRGAGGLRGRRAGSLTLGQQGQGGLDGVRVP